MNIKRSWFDVWLTIIIEVCLGLLILLGGDFKIFMPLRVVLGCLVVLILPGYFISLIMFPLKGDLPLMERVGISIGLSISVAPLQALIINIFELGFSYNVIFGLYSAVINFGILGAVFRFSRIADEEVFSIQQKHISTADFRSFRKLLMIFVAPMFIVFLFVVIIFIVPSSQDLYTSFYILGRDNEVAHYPSEVIAGEPIEIAIGIENFELSEHQYRIEVWAIDMWGILPRTLLESKGPYLVEKNETMNEILTLQMPWEGNNQKVEFLLFVDDRIDPYRHLELWLNVSP
ncbi:DUF1616 domain-containing protein [Chloroflexota bacterium]